MRVTFRPIEKHDCDRIRQDWKRLQARRRGGFSVGRVIAFDGRAIVAFDHHGHVVYQDDRFPVAELIRAEKRLDRALAEVNYSAVRELRAGRT
jgi:hypothetical protein